jgi:fumarate reductase subunit C
MLNIIIIFLIIIITVSMLRSTQIHVSCNYEACEESIEKKRILKAYILQARWAGGLTN